MEHFETKLTVIGTGMTGMAATLFAANRGIDTVLVGSTSEIMFASGFIDLLGVHPIHERKSWKNPWQGIAEVRRDIPNHPYARMDETDIRTAFDQALSFLKDAGLPYLRRNEQNCRAVTSLGTLKSTYCIPHTMWAGVEALEEKSPCLLVDFRGLKGFSARQIAAVLQHEWPNLRTVRISFPEMEHMEEVYTEALARNLSMEHNRVKLAEVIRPHVKGSVYVGLPAILGISSSYEVACDISDKIGAKVFEIPTMPPSVPGLRLKEAFEEQFPLRGVRPFFQKQVLNVHNGPGGEFKLDIGGDTTEFGVKTDGIIMASGRFLGGGLRADRHQIRETIFGLPVTQPSDRRLWHRRSFLDSRGHPVNRCGLEIDDEFRPLDKSGHPAYPNLFAAGSVLAHQDWMRMKCGSGLAIATAYKAVKAYSQMNERPVGP